jgi:GT2 family glycosyltransferase
MLPPVSTTPTASVVVPTYNRLETLRAVLAALAREPEVERGAAEIVVVDDGSTDGTREWLRGQAATRPELVVRTQSNAGPAVARNRGVEAARGALVLFLGDDTVPAPGWLHEHLEEHRLFGRERMLAVLGYTSFPASEGGPFARHINEYGAQFGYLLIERPTDVAFNFFYTSNISLPRRLMLDLGGFRQDFPAAAWEDIEFAYRAVSRGLRIRYQPRARVVHEHRIRPRTFSRRQRTSGRSGAIFARLHPELEGFLGIHQARRAAWYDRFVDGLLTVAVELGDRIPGTVPARVVRRLLDRSYHAGLAEGVGAERARRPGQLRGLSTKGA